MAVDLTPEAIEARRVAEHKTGKRGGHTGRELIQQASRRYWDADKLMKRSARHRNAGVARKLRERAREALMTAAVQLRTAERCRLDGGYLHQLSLDQLDAIKREVIALYHDHPADEEPGGKLAVDTLVRLREQKHRIGEEA